MLRTFDIVAIKESAPDGEIRGRTGYIVGEVTPEQVGVYVYDLGMVWCLHPSDVRPSGERDEAAKLNRGSPIRVNQKGEIVG